MIKKEYHRQNELSSRPAVKVVVSLRQESALLKPVDKNVVLVQANEQLKKRTLLNFTRIYSEEQSPATYYNENLFSLKSDLQRSNVMLLLLGQPGAGKSSLLLGRREPGILLEFVDDYFGTTSGAKMSMSLMEFRQTSFFDLLAHSDTPLYLRRGREVSPEPALQVRIKSMRDFVRVLKVGLAKNQTRDFKKQQFEGERKRPNHLVVTLWFQGESKHQLVIIDPMQETEDISMSLSRSAIGMMAALGMARAKDQRAFTCDFTDYFKSTLARTQTLFILHTIKSPSPNDIRLMKFSSKLITNPPCFRTTAPQERQRPDNLLLQIRARVEQQVEKSNSPLFQFFDFAQEEILKARRHVEKVLQLRGRYLVRGNTALNCSLRFIQSAFKLNRARDLVEGLTPDVFYMELRSAVHQETLRTAQVLSRYYHYFKQPIVRRREGQLPFPQQLSRHSSDLLQNWLQARLNNLQSESTTMFMQNFYEANQILMQLQQISKGVQNLFKQSMEAQFVHSLIQKPMMNNSSFLGGPLEGQQFKEDEIIEQAKKQEPELAKIILPSFKYTNQDCDRRINGPPRPRNLRIRLRKLEHAQPDRNQQLQRYYAYLGEIGKVSCNRLKKVHSTLL